MLNGIAPIIIFNFKKLAASKLESINSIPLLAENKLSIPLIPIPLYLEEISRFGSSGVEGVSRAGTVSGIYIDSESKSIDIETKPQTLPDGKTPKATQRGLNSVVTINMIASSNSVGLSVLMAMSDLIFQKVTSQEYSITYINKSMTVFGGLLESFSVLQNSNNDLYNISMQISRVTGGSTVEKAAPATLERASGEVPLSAGA